MSNNWKFELYKIKREIKKYGKEYTFKRNEVDEYGEPTGNIITVGTIKGIYHDTTNGFINLITSEATKIVSKKSSYIIGNYQEMTALGLQLKDWTTINGKDYEYHEICNIQEMNIIGDINIELKEMEVGDSNEKPRS